MIAPPLARRLPLVAALAVVTLVLIAVRAWCTVDPYWDTLAYHWVVAARSAGLCDRDCFSLPPVLEAAYDGFPMLIHRIQGWLWRLTGTPAAGDLVNVAAVLALGAYLRARFRVPLAWSWLGLLAIPAVQIGLTTTYVDVAVNAAATIALFVLIRLLVEPNADHRVDVILALAALAFAVGGKLLMVPIAFVAWAAIMAVVVHAPARVRLARRDVAFAVLAIAGAVALLPGLVANAVAFANPFYPVDVRLGGVHFSGPLPMHQPNTVSLAWLDSPQPLRWIASVSEYDSFRGRPLPWTIGQGDVAHESPSFRMGGYFVAYVLAAWAMLGWSALSAPKARWPLALMVGLSLLCALLPASHELRYYLFWMMTLVCSVLAAAYAPAFQSGDQPRRRAAAHAAVLIAGATVVLMTGAAYLRTDGPTLRDLVVHTESTVAPLRDDDVLCIRDASRFAFLYAAVFHPPRRYRTRLLVADEPAAQCTTRVTLPY